MHKIYSKQHNRLQARRQFLKTSGMGLGVTALASLLPQNSAAQSAGPASRGRSTSSSCSWPVRQVRSICSTTSRISRSCSSNRCPRASAWGSA